ncbi:MAG: hypothetical protein FWH20_01035 [Oscillospiraceae bacterium]|nr:hypothetical protein [Oscillospiraceae bacterium]
MEKAKEIFGKLALFIKTKWEAANKATRMVIMGLFAATVISLAFVIVLSRQTGYEVLYTEVADSERGEIFTALGELGITDYNYSAGTISVPSNQLEYARMQLAMQGYPRTTFNYDIWNEGVGMFSTEAQVKEVQRQQLEANIAATLRQITKIKHADVIITPADERRHVLNADRENARAAVTLTLTDRLSAKEIEGVRNLVLTSVPRLTDENLTIINQDGMPLIPEDMGNAESQLVLDMQRIREQNAYRNMVQNDIVDSISALLEGTVRDFRVAAFANIDFSNWNSDSITYQGVNVDENGFQHGPISDEQRSLIMNGMNLDADLVGAIINADISPGYPTYDPETMGEIFLENMINTNYLVDTHRKIAESNGATLEDITIAVQIHESAMTQDQLDEWRYLVAMGAGQPVDNVSVKATIFPPAGPDFDEAAPIPVVRNVLIFVVIALGALLIILFLLAIMSSGSRKRKLVRSNAAYQGIGGTPAFDDEYNTFNVRIADEEDAVQIQSLLHPEGSETREALLKNEIREFAQSSPDIVAQLIRTWIREE